MNLEVFRDGGLLLALWVDLGIKSGISVWELISTLKKKKKNEDGE